MLVELQDPEGVPIDGFGLDSCLEMFGDQIDRLAVWDGSERFDIPDRRCKIRFRMRDAHLFAFRFAESRPRIASFPGSSLGTQDLEVPASHK